jgi:hypothetical protein
MPMFTNDGQCSNECIPLLLRQRRDADTFPQILQFNLTSNTKHIKLFLRRNSLKAAVPYYTQEYDEIVKHTPANEKVGKYIFKTCSE